MWRNYAPTKRPCCRAPEHPQGDSSSGHPTELTDRPLCRLCRLCHRVPSPHTRGDSAAPGQLCAPAGRQAGLPRPVCKAGPGLVPPGRVLSTQRAHPRQLLTPASGRQQDCHPPPSAAHVARTPFSKADAVSRRLLLSWRPPGIRHGALAESLPRTGAEFSKNFRDYCFK